MSKITNSLHPLYYVLKTMVMRCEKKDHPTYKKYGGKGVTVFEEWKNDPSKFISWGLQNGYQKGLQIDRIEGTKGYYPENCRFVTGLVNNNNRSCTRMITRNNQTKTLKEWGDELGISYGTMSARYSKFGATSENLFLPLRRWS